MQYKSQIVDFILYKNGTDGEDGNTPYVHIKYSNDGGTTFTDNNGENVGEWLGIYVDYNESDPIDPSKYKWTKVKGEPGIPGVDGLQGPQGEQGIPGQDAAEIIFEYALSDSSTIPPSSYDPSSVIPSTGDKLGTPVIYLAAGDGAWSTTMPTRAEGQYIWQRIKRVYADGTITIGTPVCITGEKGDAGVAGAAGNDGLTSYFHIKYSAVENPTSPDQLSETPDVFIGTYVDYTEEDSTDPTKYKWCRLQGMQGEQGIPGQNGDNGKTSYLHIKYGNYDGTVYTFTDNNGEDPGDYIGQYVDFVEDDSTNVDDYKWSKIKGEQGIQGLQGIQGPQGEQGIAGTDAAEIVFEYALSDSPTTPPISNPSGSTIPSAGDRLGTPVIYLETGDGTWSTTIPERSEGQYLWQRIRYIYADGTIVTGQPVCVTGDKGEQGIQGPQGETGESGATTYFHIKYSSVPTPESSDQMSETPDTYIGTYVDFTENDSTDPSKYKWCRLQGIQGEQGEQGIPGQNGEDGLTSYLHVKYSDDGGATFTANNGETVGDYIGQYVDFTEQDSANVGDYKWSKIKGEQGPQGERGVGVTILGSYATEDELLAAHPTGNLGDAYLVGGNLYVWSGQAWENVGNIQGPQGDPGEQGDKGDAGQSVVSVVTQYYVSSSMTECVGGEWSTELPSEYTGNTYIWTRLEITYTNPDSVEYTDPYFDSSAWGAIGNAQDTANNAQDTANNNAENLVTVESTIQVLVDNIRMLVVDGNGESLMQQTSSGWTFSTSEIQGQVNAASELLAQLVEQTGDVQLAIDRLSDSVDEFGVIAEFIKTGSYTYTDENGVEQTEPSIDLFETDTGFKLKITNTRILFTDGASPLLSIDSKDKSLTTEKVTIERELQIGRAVPTEGTWIWKRRTNGNLGLSWKEGILAAPVIELMEEVT